MENIKVLVCDDQNISRQLFEMYVKSDEKYRLAYSISSASVADIYCEKYNIDLVIMDVVMKDGSNGIESAKKIKQKNPDIKIIIVTSMPETSYIDKAKEAGVDSFWYKEISKETLLEVMDKTMDGENIFPASVPVMYIGNAKTSEFTESEIEILREMTTGASNAEIADKFCISIQTVKNHVTHMLDKTGFNNRTRLAIEARVSGFVIGK